MDMTMPTELKTMAVLVNGNLASLALATSV